MQEKKEAPGATPILIGAAIVAVIALLGFLYSRYIYERTISPEETMAKMRGASEKQQRARQSRTNPPGGAGQ